MPAYKDKTGKWFAKFQFTDYDGKRKTKFKRGFDRKKDALDYERKFLTDNTSSPDITFSALAERFLEAKTGEVAAATLDSYHSAISAAKIIQNKKINEITPQDILSVRSSIKVSPATVNLYMAKISVMFDFAVDYYDLRKNPCATVGRLKTVKPQITFLTIEEVEKVKENARPDIRVLIDVLFWTGMRISEALALTKQDIHDGYLSVFKHKLQNGAVSQGLKNNSGRNVPITPALQKELKEYSEQIMQDELFPLAYITYDRRFKELFNAAELNATIHSLRHSHVAMLIHMGCSPKLIADRIGDTVSTMLDTYAHVYSEDMSDMIKTLEMYQNSIRQA